MKKLMLFAAAGLMAMACSTKYLEPEVIPDPNPTHGLEPSEVVELTFSAANQNEVVVRMKGSDASSTLTAILAEELEDDIVLNVSLDREYLLDAAEDLLPTDFYDMDGDVIEIEAGERGGEINVDFYVENMPFAKTYVLPLILEPESAGVVCKENRVVYKVSRAPQKDIEMIAFPEVNNINPLNYGEVLLEDGTPFFDYVVLFAYNINYNAAEDRVYLHSNPNCQALLDESETYLQPLRRKGIKVLMGLLGNHDAAGLAQLSPWGAKEFAKEVAAAIKKYGMDGVNLDDEYSSTPIIGNKWFESHGAAAGSRLCYELKQAMKEAKCDDSIVSIFNWGALYTMPAVDGHDPSEFIDQCVGNYGSRGTISGNMTNKWATGGSYECNYGQYASASTAESIKNAGYGFMMYFNPDPATMRGYFGENGYFSQAAQGAYGQKCQPMKQWYKKIGEGEYDPKPYNW